MTTLTIAHLYPEQMNIYGDRGNILTLVQRCRWRGIEPRVEAIKPGQAVDWTRYDLAFFGGGQDSGQALIAEDFVQRHGPNLTAAINDGLVLLAICGGYQLLGHYFLTHTGEKLPGIGALDLHTVGGEQRLIGNIVIEWTRGTGHGARVMGHGSQIEQADRQPSTGNPRPSTFDRQLSTFDLRPSTFDLRPSTFDLRLVGFENHSGRTYLGSQIQPLGRVLRGYGNNGEDRTEGGVYRNAHGCYMHGSLLPKNPHFADHLLRLALQRRYGTAAALTPLDDTLELRAHAAMVARLV